MIPMSFDFPSTAFGKALK